jgi:hypothetical protein
MPGGTGGEFALLDEDDVGPAFEGEVIEKPNAHDAATDDHDTGMGFHGSDSGGKFF